METPPDLEVSWVDRQRKATEPANPFYPKGKDVDVSAGAAKACMVVLPCPAPRGQEDRQCGLWLIKCKRCGVNNVVTTAGRLDDPRTVRMACRLN